MAVTTPALGGTTLPQVSARDGFYETGEYRGGDVITANGNVVTDLLTTTLKYVFELHWVGLTESQVTTVRTAWATVDDSSASFTSPRGGSHTVTRDVGANLDIVWYKAADGLRADVTMRLRETTS